MEVHPEARSCTHQSGMPSFVNRADNQRRRKQDSMPLPFGPRASGTFGLPREISLRASMSDCDGQEEDDAKVEHNRQWEKEGRACAIASDHAEPAAHANDRAHLAVNKQDFRP